MTDLCVLAEKYGTDKLGFYTPIYDLLLSGRRESVSRVLEVGIGTPETMRHMKDYKSGASLRMWRDYFSKAVIYGLDIDENACAEASNPQERIVTVCVSSKEPMISSSRHLLYRFDLIIDDGDHELQSQIETFRVLSPLLVSGGLYIIEDCDYSPDLIFTSSSLPIHTRAYQVTEHGVGKAVVIRQEDIADAI